MIMKAIFFFAKNQAVTSNFIQVSKTMAKFRKKQSSNSKKMPGQTGSQTEGWTDPVL